MDTFARYALLTLIVVIVSVADAAAGSTSSNRPIVSGLLRDDATSPALKPIMFEYGYHHVRQLVPDGAGTIERPSDFAHADRDNREQRRYAEYFNRHYLARRSIALRFEDQLQVR